MTFLPHIQAGTFFLAALLALSPCALRAQENSLPSPGSVPLAKGVPASSSADVFVPASGALPVAATGSAPAASPSAAGSPSSALPGVPGSNPSNSPLTESPTTPQIVKDAVTGLQKTDAINLDDMIRAQDAINRLDLLLEIEKRQSELKKIRDERNKPASPIGLGSFPGMGLPTSAIPASALGAPPPQPKLPKPRRDDDEEDSPSSSGGIDKYGLKRIFGAEGKYTAILSAGDDKTVTARAGDKLSDGTVVKSVALTSVRLAKGKKMKTLSVPSEAYIVRGASGATE